MDRDPLEPALGYLRPPGHAAVEELPDGFAFRYEQDWGRFRSVRLAAAEPDVVFQVEPRMCATCGLAAIRFPACLRSWRTPPRWSIHCRRAHRSIQFGARLDDAR
ncbi:MAG: hypothetical protein U0Q18_23685 [Bryobacteraceae bacterium]